MQVLSQRRPPPAAAHSRRQPYSAPAHLYWTLDSLIPSRKSPDQVYDSTERTNRHACLSGLCRNVWRQGS